MACQPNVLVWSVALALVTAQSVVGQEDRELPKLKSGRDAALVGDYVQGTVQIPGSRDIYGDQWYADEEQRRLHEHVRLFHFDFEGDFREKDIREELAIVVESLDTNDLTGSPEDDLKSRHLRRNWGAVPSRVFVTGWYKPAIRESGWIAIKRDSDPGVTPGVYFIDSYGNRPQPSYPNGRRLPGHLNHDGIAEWKWRPNVRIRLKVHAGWVLWENYGN